MSNELRILGRINLKFFTRERKMPFPAMIVFIINLVKKSLQLELNSFTDLCNNESDITKQAFSKSRQNLSPEVFKLLNEKLVLETYSDNEIKTFQGFRVFGIDGSTIRLPSSDELYKEYGFDMKSNSVPLAKTSVLYDALNHISIHAKLQSYRTSERDMAMEHIIELCRLDELIKGDHIGDIIIFDRGYPSLFFMFFMLSKNKHFIMRCSSSFLTEVNTVVKDGWLDTVITIPAFKQGRIPSPEFTKHLPHLKQDAAMKIRILRFDLSSGEQEILVTSLIDKDVFTYGDFFTLYGMRWNSEEAYKLYKCIAEIENFSGKSKITIEQDFLATLFTCNLSSLLMQEAQTEVEQERLDKIENGDANKCKYAYKINRNVLIGSIKNEIVQVLLSDCDLDAYCERLKVRIKKSLVPIRPGRSFPRIFRNREKAVNRRAL
jgi:hypothetical protein